MGWKTEAKQAKKLHRPTLKDWAGDNLVEEFPSFQRSILKKHTRFESFHNHTDIEPPKNLPKSDSFFNHAKDLSTREFIDRFESNQIPVVIDGICEEAKWAALERWDLQALKSSSIFREYRFKCGEDDNEKSIRMKLKYFLKYLRKNRDDSPLYIFDSTFEDDRIAKRLLDDYKVPRYFDEDLFRLVGESRRPPYRWFLIGPERSGSTVHIDPLATSAWNTLISGKKRWVLFPPWISKRVVKGKDLIKKNEDDEASHYFMNILPRMKNRAALAKQKRDKLYENFSCYEFTQSAGETVFVPNGWWHAVLNLTDTVAVTQNFVSQRNFDQAWVKSRQGRKKMAWKWLCQLETHYPHLAKRAKEMNKRDGFVMKYDTTELRRRQEEDERRQHKKHTKKKRKRGSSRSRSDKLPSQSRSDLKQAKENDGHKKELGNSSNTPIISKATSNGSKHSDQKKKKHRSASSRIVSPESSD